MHLRIEEETMIKLPYVSAWSRFPVCPKCASTLGAGIWLLAMYRQSKGESSVRYAWCKGDQNSTVAVPGMSFGEDGPRMDVANVNVPCFGVIYEEHLHLVTCGRCNYAWLMDVKHGK